MERNSTFVVSIFNIPLSLARFARKLDPIDFQSKTKKSGKNSILVKLLTNLPKDKLPLQLMPILCEKLASTLEKDLKAFNWILETDKNMSKGPNNETTPYIYMEIRALKVFDTREQMVQHMPKLFGIMTDLTGLGQDQIHILAAPVEPFYLGVNGSIKN